MNGYGEKLIKRLIRKQKRKLFVKNLTKLRPEVEVEKKWMKVTYFPQVTNKLTSVLRSQAIEPAFSSANKIKIDCAITRTKLS